MITVLVIYPPLCLYAAPCTILPLSLHHLPISQQISGTPGQVTASVLIHDTSVLDTIVQEGKNTGQPTVQPAPQFLHVCRSLIKFPPASVPSAHYRVPLLFCVAHSVEVVGEGKIQISPSTVLHPEQVSPQWLHFSLIYFPVQSFCVAHGIMPSL